MLDVAVQLYGLAMWTALVLTIPVIVAVAAVGILISLIQTALGVQDQNVSFAPKIAAVASLLAVGGTPGIALLAHLFSVAIHALPRLAG